MARAIILMMDSFGIGGAKDAAAYNNEGANTFGHIAEYYQGLKIPNLYHLGLSDAAYGACGQYPKLSAQTESILQFGHKYGHMSEISKDKDTVSGHWELAGLPNLQGWGHFPPNYPSFPADLIQKICEKGKIEGILGNKAASGTVIIEELGEEHMKTGKPICYTSADSVFQIAAHEKHFGLERLYNLCEIAFKHLKPYNIARVIARPFEGEKKGEFKRTKNRHDYSVTPPHETLLDVMKNAGGNVISVGKIADIYAHCGITRAVKASGLQELWDVTLQEVKNAPGNSIVFTNFVDFDMTWGHRRDVEGYAKGLEYFDSRLPELVPLLKEKDIVFVTADHGCDPTYKGTDHTREHVPVLMFGKNVKAGFVGGRDSYSDLGQTAAEYLGLPKLLTGKSFLNN